MTDEQITQNASQYCDIMNDKNEDIRLIRFASYTVGATTTKDIIEKENAELKKQQFSLRNERNTFLAQNEQYEKDLIGFNENLTKAKELIKRLMHELVVSNRPYDEVELLVKDVEQFLNSEVEK